MLGHKRYPPLNNEGSKRSCLIYQLLKGEIKRAILNCLSKIFEKMTIIEAETRISCLLRLNSENSILSVFSLYEI